MLLLYLARSGQTANAYITLHSTMLLLYHSSAFCIYYKFLLYIPLCFYYIATLISSFSVPASLHSTMLLLYPCPTHYIFHGILPLHSTMLLLYPCYGQTEPYTASFTFHYASTISEWKVECFSGDEALHSTMLLLYHISSNTIFI